jgi:hypothetical protein
MPVGRSWVETFRNENRIYEARHILGRVVTELIP